MLRWSKTKRMIRLSAIACVITKALPGCVCVCVCFSSVYSTYKCVLNIFVAAGGSSMLFSLNPGLAAWGSVLKKAGLFTSLSSFLSLLWLPLSSFLSLLAFLPVSPSFFSPSFLSLLSVLPRTSSLSLFTFPWTKPLGRFPGMCFCPLTIGECNLKTFFHEIRQDLPTWVVSWSMSFLWLIKHWQIKIWTGASFAFNGIKFSEM